MLIAIAIIIINTKLLLTDCKMQIRIFVPTLARIALLYDTSNIELEATFEVSNEVSSVDTN